MAEQVTIAALGDSLIHGYGLAQDQGFVPQLQDWLTENNVDATLINAGVSGDTTAGGAARINWTLTPDVDALIVSLGGNDILRGLDPANSRKNLAKILGVAADNNIPVLLIGVPAPSNYGPDYKTAFDAIYPELSVQFGTLIYPNIFTSIASLPDQSSVLGTYFQADALHPNAEGVALIISDIGPQVAQLADLVHDRK